MRLPRCAELGWLAAYAALGLGEEDTARGPEARGARARRRATKRRGANAATVPPGGRSQDLVWGASSPRLVPHPSPAAVRQRKWNPTDSRACRSSASRACTSSARKRSLMRPARRRGSATRTALRTVSVARQCRRAPGHAGRRRRGPGGRRRRARRAARRRGAAGSGGGGWSRSAGPRGGRGRSGARGQVRGAAARRRRPREGPRDSTR
jgi:hypothetical protein